MKRIKFFNLVIVFAILFVMLPMQAFATAENLPIIRMTGATTWNGVKYVPVGDATFSTNVRIKPTSLTIIKNGQPMTAQLSWEGNSTRMYIPEGVEFLYFNTGTEVLTHRVIPQGHTRRLWAETENRNATCVKPCK